MRSSLMFLAGVAAVATSSSAFAASVLDGTVSSVALFNPRVSLSSNPSTYGAINGNTFQISGTGGFSNLTSTLGRLNGTLLFAQAIGGVVNQSLNNFFTFSDLRGGNYSFSTTSVRTNALVQGGSANSGTLLVQGNVLNNNLGYTATPASLSIQFNNTGGSAYSSALTLSVPPVSGVPEPATWAMMVFGIGAVGATMRRRQKVTTRVSYAV